MDRPVCVVSACAADNRLGSFFGKRLEKHRPGYEPVAELDPPLFSSVWSAIRRGAGSLMFLLVTVIKTFLRS